MQIQSLFTKILGFLVIIITLALAPSIVTANTAITSSGNLTADMIGMSVIGGFGAPLIILGLLVSGGVFAIAGVKGQLGGASFTDLFSVIGSVVVVIVLLTMFSNILDYVKALIDASTGFAVVIYGIIPLLLYIGVIAGAGWVQYRAYRRMKGGRRASRSAKFANL